MMDVAKPIFAVLGLAVVVFCVFLLVRAGIRAKKQRLAKEIEQAQLAIERMEAAGGDTSKFPDLTDQVKGLVLSPGERCFALCREVRRVVQAHLTTYSGGSQGVSFRIPKGIRYRISSYEEIPVRTEYEKVQETGSLHVTTYRVVFTGTREVTSIGGEKVADIRIEGDHLWIFAENRKTPLGLKVTVPAAHMLAYATRLLAESCQATKR
jgi:hypothetical protein